MIYPNDGDIINALHKVAQSNLVDVSSGTDSVYTWASEIKHLHFRKNPEVIVLILEKKDDKYVGSLYATGHDLERRAR